MEDCLTTTAMDKEIALRMRQDNYERFKTLVRMHLSFELDLNTDEFDLPCHEVVYFEKGKVKKWSKLSKKIKGCTSGKYGSPTDNGNFHLTMELIYQLRQLKSFLLKEENIIQEGIFRRTGSVSRQNELRSLISKNKILSLEEGYTVHDCATVFKSYLADLSEPLLTDAHYPAHLQIAELCNGIENSSITKERHLLNSVQLLLLLLPDENRLLLEDIIQMLNTTTKYEKSNKMSADSLATLFAPHLICPRNLPPEALHYVSQNMSSVISYMITKGTEIFDVPPKLATDIRAYFLDQKRKKTMSPEQTLDESISDISTVNTVYTFIDREKTAAAHNSNPTDTALAQLYAHIQTLPESSKKRKLIKQFNKENGQGTPLQLLMLNRIKSSGSNRSAKSISDSIRKHIFPRSIISKTPKSTNQNSAFGTPNGANAIPKLRVLFQSPISNSSMTETITSASIKSHPLQKSISSSSLLTEAAKPVSSIKTSSSAPVSRASSDISDANTEELPTAVQEIITEESSTNEDNNDSDKKSIEWKCGNLNTDDDDSTPARGDFKSRYKSEPNLSKTLNHEGYKLTPGDRGKFLTSKLIKGVSMNNIQYSITPESVRNPKKTSSLLKLKISEDNDSDFESPFKDTAKEIYTEVNNLQLINKRRNVDLITSTPSLLLERRSMSPITKSTQRMPKSMQESIMTPRSRKPVMLTNTLGSSEQNQTTFQSDLSSFREEEEDSLDSELSKASSTPGYKSRSESGFYIGETGQSQTRTQSRASSAPGSLTNTFREYLLSRSVLTASPVDSSFSSHPDDFGSRPDIQELNESELSESLLYCLDGNQPKENFLLSGLTSHCDIKRKRSSAEFDEDIESVADQPNKLLIIEESPGETSL